MKKQTRLLGNSKPILKRIILLFIILTIGLTNESFAQGDCSSVNGNDTDITTPEKITKYAVSGEFDKLKSLIEKDGKLVNQILEHGETALTLACYHGHLEMVKYLLDKGADTEIINKWNNNALLNTAMKGRVKIGELLLEKGANLHVQGENKNTVLHFAVRSNFPDYVEMAIKRGAKVNVMNQYNQSPILYASWSANPKMIKSLVENGADINFVSKHGVSILHNLCSNGNIDAVKYAIKKGAKVNKLDAEGYLPLHIAVKRQHSKLVKYLAGLTENIDAKEKHFGNTALHCAAVNGDLLSTKELVETGADSNVKNNNGLTAFDFASQYGYVKLSEYYSSNKLTESNIVQMAKKSRKQVNKKINSDEVRFWYTGHSGWVMQFRDKVILVDYWKGNNKINEASLANGNINLEEFKGKKIYVLSSHAHGDHYDTTIFAWQKQIKNIKYIYGFRAEEAWVHNESGYNGPAYTIIDDNKSKTVDDIKITTIKSNDTGQGFLLEIDGVKIFHPGDHALFNADLKDDYTKEIDFLAKQTTEIDVAFLPTTGCPSRWQKESIIEGFFYVVNKLNPKVVFPMHSFGREYLLREFAEIAKKRKSNTKVICVENCGDNYLYNKAFETAGK